MHFSRDLLYERHRLSHQQINDVLGVAENNFPLKEKLSDMAKIGDFIALTDRFRKEKIDFISLKGPLLSQRIYGDPTYRRYRDFDFLFETQQDTDRAYNLLLDKGYVPLSVKLPEREDDKKLFYKNFYDIPLYNSKNNMTVELHAKLLKFSTLKDETLNHIIHPNLMAMTLSGRRFKVLDNELELLFLIIHGGLHRFSRLKWLVDIKDLLNIISIDEEKFRSLVEKTNSEKLVGLCREVLKVYFPEVDFFKGYPKPGRSMVSNVIQSIEDENVNDKANFKKFIRYMYFTWSIQPGWKSRLSVISKQLYLSSAVNSKNKNNLPLFLQLLQVPFYTLKRWVSSQNK